MSVGIAANDPRAEPVGAPPAPEPFRAPHHHVDGFLPIELAREMRAAIDRHFAEPYKQTASVHQVWNYWFVPDMYTFLRTAPEKVIPMRLVQQFHAALSSWAWNVLGMGQVTQPYLSLYVDGCGQQLHNDATNGRFGYVYSLTWEERDTKGGETMVLHEGDLYRQNLTNQMGGRRGLYELIEPKFNRLAIFDDRMPHGVNRIEGSMNPVHGRIVLHGHISETGPGVRGGLSAVEVGAGVEEAANEALSGRELSCDPHGPVVVRLSIGESGEVRQARLLLDRIAFTDGSSAQGIADSILAAVGSRRFPASDQPTEAIIPILLGGPLPWMLKRQEQASKPEA
ncbi:hypothetical protein [Allosphingosinicella sp.]|jgi:hypothetical protein|uniref:hypothetical protein n=1 Tax=Allosphingosinicella sp. TaxID=2823234 RepID=UPI002F02BCD7